MCIFKTIIGADFVQSVCTLGVERFGSNVRTQFYFISWTVKNFLNQSEIRTDSPNLTLTSLQCTVS